MIEELIDLIRKAVDKTATNAEMESLKSQFMRMMTVSKNESVVPYAPAQVGTDVDKLDGHDGSFYQNADNINAGTMNTDRYSAYADLTAESKIGTGATQVAAGNHPHDVADLTSGTSTDGQVPTSDGAGGVAWETGGIINPMTTAGDMIYQPGSYTVANADATGNKVINATPSSAEKIIPVCDLAIANPVGNITITWDAWVSMNQLGTQKKVTVRLRRDTITGAILWSQEKIMATDSVLGHDQRFNSSLVDTAVTTGRYVLTSQATGASVVDIYGDTRTFTIAGYTNTPSRLPLGAVAGYVLSVNAGVTAPEWANRGVTNGDSHDHSGGDGAQINHTTLSNIGTNTHAQIDTFIASKGAASGVASLNASTKVVEDPANATATPAASKIPIADASGKLDGWISVLLDGWLDLGLTGTYVGATSFTMSGDYTAYFKPYAKFKCVNSTTKFGYVLSSSYAAPNTTVNLVPNTSYSLANAAITDIKISYASPPDFPNLLAYTPTLSARSGSFTNATVSGNFSITDRKCHVEITITIVTNGTASGIIATTPVDFSSITIFAGRENQTTGILLQGIGYNNFINIFNYAGADINADNLTIYINGEYPI